MPVYYPCEQVVVAVLTGLLTSRAYDWPNRVDAELVHLGRL